MHFTRSGGMWATLIILTGFCIATLYSCPPAQASRYWMVPWICVVRLSSSEVCRSYFCTNNSIPYYLQSSTYLPDKRVAMQRYCSQCNLTSSQRFNFVNQSLCPYFSNLCYPGRCIGNTSCIMYDWAGGAICYLWDQNIYYRWNDYFHSSVYWVYYRTMDYIIFPLFLFVTLFLAPLPEFIHMERSVDNSQSSLYKFLHFFSLKMFAILLILIGLFVYDVTLLLDSIGFTNSKLAWFGGLVTWPAYWISFMSIVIEWHHIISQVEGSGASELFIGWNRVFSFGFFLICFLFWYAIGVGLTIGITLSEIPATRYALGSYTLLSMLITLGMNIILVIFSIRFLWLISMKGHMTQNVFRVSFSKMVIWLVLGSIPMILVLIAISCCLLIGLDAFSLVAWLFFPHIAY
jgi:hypothetical protein